MKLENRLGKILGRGEGGIVYEDTQSDKVIKHDQSNLADFKREVKFQQDAARIYVAPKIYAVEGHYVLMDRIQPVDKLKGLTKSDEIALIHLLAKLVGVGIIHNDLHTGNIGRLMDGGMTIIDFGFTIKIDPPKNKTIFSQLLMAQLYALIDPCNINNRVDCDKDSPIIDVIYYIRQNNQKYIDSLWNIAKLAQREFA